MHRQGFCGALRLAHRSEQQRHQAVDVALRTGQAAGTDARSANPPKSMPTMDVALRGTMPRTVAIGL